MLSEAGLEEFVTPPYVHTGARHIFHQYVIRIRDGRRDALLEHLKTNGVGTKIYYPVPLHMQPCFAYLGYKEGDFPESERAARETLALPMYPELTREQQEYVVETLRRFFA
jgi:dTDP-4-amino-4,6-dideoxygalactose transaminase